MWMRIATIAAAAIVSGTAWAADSPQFRGPERTGLFPETGLLQAWPTGGPELAWVADGLGKGYPSLDVVGGVIYTLGMLDDGQGYLFALDTNGKIQNKVAYGAETQDKQAPGSRTTPTIDGTQMYVMSGLGVLGCYKLPDLAKVWEVDTLKTFNGPKITWDIAESVLVDGNLVFATPGGPDASVVALDKMTGTTVWTSKGLSDPASYCSPAIIDHKGKRILVTETAKLVVGLDPASGKLLWTHSHETDYDIHAVAPVYADGLLYYTGGYKSGGGALALSDDGASVTPKWQDTTLDCQHHGVILKDGYLYGTGHQSFNGLICLELKTGKVMWQTKDVTQGAVIYADGMLYVYEGPKAGVMDLVKASPAGFERTGSFKVTQGSTNHWSHPVIANGMLYVRHGDALMAYKIAVK